MFGDFHQNMRITQSSSCKLDMVFKKVWIFPFGRIFCIRWCNYVSPTNLCIVTNLLIRKKHVRGKRLTMFLLQIYAQFFFKIKFAQVLIRNVRLTQDLIACLNNEMNIRLRLKGQITKHIKVCLPQYVQKTGQTSENFIKCCLFFAAITYNSLFYFRIG